MSSRSQNFLVPKVILFSILIIYAVFVGTFLLGNAQAATQQTVAIKSNVTGVNVNVLESDSTHTVMRFEIGSFNKEQVTINGQNYFKISLPGEGITLDKGQPELPKVCRSIVIPDDAKMDIRVVDSQYTDFPSTTVVPSKGNISRDVNPDSIPYTFGSAYKEKKQYPEKLAAIGDPYIMRDLRGLVVEVEPFQYQPATNTLRVYTSVTVEVMKKGTDDKNVLRRSSTNKSVKLNKEFAPVYESRFVNYSSTQTILQSAAVEQSGELLVISYDSFYNAMLPLVNWKKLRGIPTTIVKLSSITTSNNSAEIKNYIQNYYNNHPNLTWVLLVGDINQVSSPYASDFEGYESAPSDVTYAKVAGNDNYPDIYVGRFSAESVADVDTQVKRSLDFEKNGCASTAWYKKGVGIASDQTGNSSESDIVHMENIRNTLISSHMCSQVDAIYDPAASAASVISSLNDGRGLVNYCGHGSYTGWGTTGFSISNVQSLSNAGKLPFIVSVACYNGLFTNFCFAEAWLRSKDAQGQPIGAVGAYMSTLRQPWIPPMDGQDAIMSAYFNKTKTSFGGVCLVGASRMLDNYGGEGVATLNNWTVFGDPSLSMFPIQMPQIKIAKIRINGNCASGWGSGRGYGWYKTTSTGSITSVASDRISGSLYSTIDTTITLTNKINANEYFAIYGQESSIDSTKTYTFYDEYDNVIGSVTPSSLNIADTIIDYVDTSSTDNFLRFYFDGMNIQTSQQSFQADPATKIAKVMVTGTSTSGSGEVFSWYKMTSTGDLISQLSTNSQSTLYATTGETFTFSSQLGVNDSFVMTGSEISSSCAKTFAFYNQAGNIMEVIPITTISDTSNLIRNKYFSTSNDQTDTYRRFYFNGKTVIDNSEMIQKPRKVAKIRITGTGTNGGGGTFKWYKVTASGDAVIPVSGYSNGALIYTNDETITLTTLVNPGEYLAIAGGESSGACTRKFTFYDENGLIINDLTMNISDTSKVVRTSSFPSTSDEFTVFMVNTGMVVNYQQKK